MKRWLRKLKEEAAYSVVESMMVVSVLAVVVGATVGLMQTGYWMDRQAEDGYMAQNEGRRVLSQMVRLMRPGENINSNEVPIVHATNMGTVLDMRIDEDKDGVPEIARFELDTDEERIMLYLDRRDAGQYNYQAAGESYLEHYGSGTAADPTKTDICAETGALVWDESETIANKVVNKDPGNPPGVWNPQKRITKAEDDYRLFTFFGEDFDDTLDTSETNWNNFIRGVKIYVWSDIQPAEIPSPFGIQTNVHFRNVQGDD